MKRLTAIILVWCLIAFSAAPQAWALAPQTGIQQRPASLSLDAVRSLIEAQKDRYAQIAGQDNREAGYALSLRRLRNEKKIAAIINDEALEESERELIAKMMAFGKGGTFHFWGELDRDEKRALIEGLKMVDIEEVERLFQRLIVRGEQSAQVEVSAGNVTSPVIYDLTQGRNEENMRAEGIGEEALRRGEVCFLELAGGGGARLGYEHAKIMFEASQVMNKSLARMRAEKIRAMAEEYRKPIPWIIMTSDVTHDEMEAFFNDHIENGKYFGQVPVKWVKMVRQRVMPQMTNNGEFLLERKDKIVMGGFGHGDARDWVLRNEEVQRWLEGFGVKYVVMVNVDNAFLPGATEVGYHVLSSEEVRPGIEGLSVLVVEKTNPQENVGMAVLLNDKDGMVEYNQIPPELSYLKYIYEIDSAKFVIYKSDKGTYHIYSEEEFVRGIQDLGLTGRDLEKWLEGHLIRKADLPKDIIIKWLGKEYTKEMLEEFAHLWLRLGNTNTLIWSLGSLQDKGHPLPELPVMVARNKAVDGYDPDSLRYHTKESGALKANKFEIMAFHGFLTGESKGAHIMVPRTGDFAGGFAPIKERGGMDTPERAAEIYSESDTALLEGMVNWDVSDGTRVELSPAFAFKDGRYLPGRLGENGSVGANTQLYLSGAKTRIGRNFRLEGTAERGAGVQFILRVEDEYNSDARIEVGDNVRVTRSVSIHLKGRGEVIIEDGVRFDYSISFEVEDGEKLYIEEGGIQRIKDMLEVENRAADVFEMYVNFVSKGELSKANLIKKLMDSYLRVEPDFANLYKSALWIKGEIEKVEALRRDIQAQRHLDESP